MSEGGAGRKRGSERQLTKDDAELDDDDDDEARPGDEIRRPTADCRFCRRFRPTAEALAEAGPAACGRPARRRATDGGAQAGTFQKASDDVLATRRIVKARRPGAPAAPAAAAANPFAGIALAPPPAQQLPEEAHKPEDDVTPPAPASAEARVGTAAIAGADGGDDDEEVESKPAPAAAAAGSIPSPMGGLISTPLEQAVPEVALVASGREPAAKVSDGGGEDEPEEDWQGAKVEDEEKDAGNDRPVDATEKKEEGTSGSSAKGFAQLSSAQNAFSNSFGSSFGTGFSFGSGGSAPAFGFSANSSSNSNSNYATSFSFGGSSAPAFGMSANNSSATTASALGTAMSGAANSFPPLSSVFGSNDKAPIHLFGAPAVPSGPVASAPAPATVTLSEVPTETGEENEKVEFSAESSLFEFVEGGRWRERGRGELRLNIPEELDRPARLVMRAKGNFRLLLNANLFADIKLTRMEGRGVSFACFNSIGEEASAPGPVTFAVKFKEPGIASGFVSMVEAHKSRGIGGKADSPTAQGEVVEGQAGEKLTSEPASVEGLEKPELDEAPKGSVIDDDNGKVED
eukprot:SM000269S09894  [mRNA]  locus=s269:115206:118862:+ [translate_table: standard]